MIIQVTDRNEHHYNGTDTYNKKEELKKIGLKWGMMINSGYEGWHKNVSSIEEAKELSMKIMDMTFAFSFDADSCIEEFGFDIAKEFYNWKNSEYEKRDI